MLAIYVKTKHSPSGNPRRGWFIADDSGNLIDFVDEGYEGHVALSRAGYQGITQTSQAIEVVPSIYRHGLQQSSISEKAKAISIAARTQNYFKSRKDD